MYKVKQLSHNHRYNVLKGLLSKQSVGKYVHSLLTTTKSTQRIETEVKPNYQNCNAS